MNAATNSNRLCLLPIVCAIFLSAVFLLPRLAIATEGGGTSKALGVDNVLAGMMPPPGLNLTNFLAFYTASHTLDSSGNDRPNLSNFDLFVTAETLRLRYVLPGVTLLGANIETRFGFNAVTDINVSFDVHTPRGTFHLQDDTTNVGDSLFGLILGWHSKYFHQMLGPEVFIPTGRFSAAALANTGRGYWSVGPSYWFTWTPLAKLEISGSLIYLINFENPDSHYASGDELSLDYLIGYWLTRDLQFGLNGYAYKQVADDEVRGHVVGDGNRGQVVAFGPMLRWHPHDARWGVVFKWQHEEAVENRASGERFLFQAAWQF
ncbi:MAG: transporter [Chthoniobacterales bacterium]